MAAERPRTVFDCMVFLQGAARRQSAAALCLWFAERGVVELCISDDVLREVSDVLTRPRVRAKFSSLTDQLVEEFIRTVRGLATHFENVPREIVFSRDPKDEPYLNLAVAARAHFLVSRDNDVLDINTPSNTTGAELRAKCPQLQILEPSAFIGAIRTRIAEVD